MVQPASKRPCVHKGATSRHRGRLSPTRIKRCQAPRGLRQRERAAHRPPRWITSLRMALKDYYKASRLPRTRYGEELAPSARGGVTSSKESIKEAETEFGPFRFSQLRCLAAKRIGTRRPAVHVTRFLLLGGLLVGPQTDKRALYHCAAS